MSLYRAAGRAAVWQVLGGGWQTLVRLGGSLVLARTLEPSDFGLFGMAMLVQEFISYIGAFGLQTGIIAKKELSEDDLATCFWSMAAVRSIMFIASFGGAPLAAHFFNDPRLTGVVRAVSFTFLVQVIEVVPNALLTKQLRFLTLNVIQAASITLETTLAIGLAAYAGFGYWSLAIAMLASAGMNAVATFLAAGWSPRFSFSATSYAYLRKFGTNTLGFSAVNYFLNNMDYLVVGRILGARALGLYEFAYRIPHQIFDRLVRPLSQVTFPALASIREDDSAVGRAYIRVVQFTAVLAFPLLGGLATVADEAVSVLWGQQWVKAVFPLRVLCLCAALRCIPGPTGAVFLSKDRPEIPFRVAVLSLLWTFAAVALLGRTMGIIGVAIAMAISVVPAYIGVVLALRMTHTRLRRLALALLPSVVCTGVLVGVAWLAKVALRQLGASDLYILPAAALLGTTAYACALLVLFRPFVYEALDAAEALTGHSMAQLRSRLGRLPFVSGLALGHGSMPGS